MSSARLKPGKNLTATEIMQKMPPGFKEAREQARRDMEKAFFIDMQAALKKSPLIFGAVSDTLRQAENSEMMCRDEYTGFSPQELAFMEKQNRQKRAAESAKTKEVERRNDLGKNLLTMNDPNANLLGLQQYTKGEN